MKITLSAGQTATISSESAKRVNLALLSGQINYKIGDSNFVDDTDITLNEDVRTDSIEFTNPSVIHIKAIQASVIQYRRE